MRLFSLLIFVAHLHAFQAPPATGVLQGRVVDSESGEPLRKANVVLNLKGTGMVGDFGRSVAINRPTGVGVPMISPNGSPATSLVTDANGTFRATLPPGEYLAWLEKTGYIYIPGQTAMASITVTAGETTNGIVFKMNKHGVIAGRVLDEDGEPVAQVQVTALRWMLANGQRSLMSQNGGTMTNDLGEYRIFGLPPGKYVVSAQAHLRPDQQSHQSYAKVYFPGVTDLGAAQRIEVTSGAVRHGTDLRLQKVRVVKVSGKVSGLSTPDQPGEVRRGGAMVMLVSRHSGPAIPMGPQPSAPVQPNGQFEIQAVAAGSYVLRVNVFGPSQNQRSAPLNLEVGDRDISGVSLQVEAAVELKGQVRTEGAPALSQMMVFLEETQPGTPDAYGRPDADGRMVFANVGRELYRLRVQGLPAGYYIKSTQMGSQDVQQTLDLTGGIAGELILSLEKGTAELTGIVTGPDQKPAPGMMVAIFNARNELVRHLPADTQGAYRFTELPPGEYRVATQNGDLSDPDVLDHLAESAEKVSLAPNAHETRALQVH